LKKVDAPNLLLKGPPTAAEMREAFKQEVKDIQQTGR